MTKQLVLYEPPEDLDVYIEVLEQPPRPSSIPKKDLDVKSIFLDNDNWERYRHTHDVQPYQVKAIEDMLDCGKTIRSFAIFECKCGNMIIVPYTCKGRSCSRCGTDYAKDWGRKLTNRLIQKTHRHVTFTLPDILWPIVESDHQWKLQAAMMKAAARAIQRMFDIHFQNRGMEVTTGSNITFHPIGRDMKYNPHLHILVPEGGLNRHSYGGKGSWCKYDYWDYPLLRGLWQDEVIRAFRCVLRDRLKKDSQLEQTIKDAARVKMGGKPGFVIKDAKDKDGKVLRIEPHMFQSVINYLGRYVRRPPVGKGRLIGYDGTHVTVKYEWYDKIHTKEIPVEDFIKAILNNIAPKNFQVCRSYGIYSNKTMSKVRWQLLGLGLKFGAPGKPGRQRRLGKGPVCKRCGGEMTLLYMVHETRKGVVKRYGELAWEISML